MFQNKEKISNYQALILVISGAIGTIYTVIAVLSVKSAERNGWLSVLMAYGIALAFGLALTKLGQRFPDKTFVQYLPVVLGKIPGKLAGIFYILTWWLITSFIISIDTYLMSEFLPTTPPLAIMVLISILAVYTVKKGFVVFARTAELFVVGMIVLMLLLMLLILPKCNFNNMIPILENGPMPVFMSLPVILPFSLQTILFMALWYPCMKQMKEGKKAVLIGMTISGVILAILVVVIIAFSGIELTINTTFPVLYISRNIQIGNFLTGFEAIFLLLWMMSTYIEVLVFFYPSVIGLAQWLNLKDYKPIVIPMAFINVILAMLPPNIIVLTKLDSLKNLYLILPLGFLIPVVWLIAAIRGLDESKPGNI